MSKIFVFGSNESGIHGAGAALVAYRKYGARYGMGYGHYGDSFAIPTKNQAITRSLPLARIGMYVQGFIAYAHGHPEHQFTVTRIGCGLAGFRDAEMAPLFEQCPDNCQFDEVWAPYLRGKKFWGTF